MLIAVEGIDASGKATQVKRLVERLSQMGPTATYDFPHYQTTTGQAILGLLTGKWGIKTSAIEQVYEINVGDIPPEKVADWIERVRRGLHDYNVAHSLISPDKVRVSVREIERAATEDKTRALVLQSLMTTNRLEVIDLLKSHAGHPDRHLVLDRYFASGLVYGASDGLDLDYLIDIHRALPPADLWVLINIPSDESVRRRPERRDEYERRAGFMAKVGAAYVSLFNGIEASQIGGSWQMVDGLGTPDEVHAKIMALVGLKLFGGSV